MSFYWPSSNLEMRSSNCSSHGSGISDKNTFDKYPVLLLKFSILCTKDIKNNILLWTSLLKQSPTAGILKGFVGTVNYQSSLFFCFPGNVWPRPLLSVFVSRFRCGDSIASNGACFFFLIYFELFYSFAALSFVLHGYGGRLDQGLALS